MKRLVLSALLIAAACAPTPTQPMAVQTQGRFKIERVGVVDDGIAYNSRRGIYVITDVETGQEWVGISGVGIAERGSHSAGKTMVEDER